MRRHDQHTTAAPCAARPGYTLRDLAAACAAIAVLASLLVVTTSKNRAAAGLNRDFGNLRQIGQWTHAYAADSEDRVPALNEAPDTIWPVLRPIPGSGQEMSNGAKHAVDIIRRLTGREDFPLPSNWYPFAYYNHLALADHVARPLPDRAWIATGDVHRMNWTDDPVNKHDRGFWQPFQQPQGGGPPAARDKRWPYSASFQLGAAWYDKGQSDWTSMDLGRTSQVLHNSYSVPSNVDLSGQRMAGAAFPSQKVLWHDYGDWYHTRRSFFFASVGSEADPRVAALLADSSAGARASVDANPGWNPEHPTNSGAMDFAYQPRDWEPPTASGNPAEAIRAGYYRWTRGGLKGRDFDGTEINTGQR